MSIGYQSALIGLCVAFLIIMVSQTPPSKQKQLWYVSGLFKHDTQPRGPGFRAKTLPGLGLLDRKYETDEDFDPQQETVQWERFEHYLAHLNKLDRNFQYKLFYIARHGQSVHNVMEHEVGRDEWERHWSRLDGDNTKTWVDARLTEKGVKQALDLRDFWYDAFTKLKLPRPQKYYTSPLARCLETTRHMFSQLEHFEQELFRPVVKEAMRERFGVHTCDKRSTRTWITSTYPDWEIEPGFTETDELWQPDRRETEEELKTRFADLLQEIFLNEDATVISLTLHSWAIRGLYEATGHPNIWPDAGHVTPLLIRAEG